MSISITTSNKIFNNKQHLMIVFSAFDGEINYKKIKNFIFIYGNNVLIGINIFNYKNEFPNIKEGYHSFSDENFLKIVQKFPKEMKLAKNDSFFKIGKIKKINDHPESKKLKILSVEIQDDKNLNIVTNIQDLNVNKNYLFAMNNSFLGTGKIIKKTKVMGIESNGMICSYKSIGINKEGLVSIEKQSISQKFEF